MLHRGEHGAIAQKEAALLVKFFIHYPGLHVCACYHVQLFTTPWTIAHQTHLSMGFPRQEYWSGLPFPTLGDLPNPGIKLTSLALAGRFFTGWPRTWATAGHSCRVSKALTEENWRMGVGWVPSAVPFGTLMLKESLKLQVGSFSRRARSFTHTYTISFNPYPRLMGYVLSSSFCRL